MRQCEKYIYFLRFDNIDWLWSGGGSALPGPPLNSAYDYSIKNFLVVFLYLFYTVSQVFTQDFFSFCSDVDRQLNVKDFIDFTHNSYISSNRKSQKICLFPNSNIVTIESLDFHFRRNYSTKEK